MDMTSFESADDLESRFSIWRDSKRFVVSKHPAPKALGEGDIVWRGVSSQQPLPLCADRAAKSLWPGRRAFLRAWPGVPGRWQKLFASLRAAVARWRTPARRGR